MRQIESYKIKSETIRRLKRERGVQVATSASVAEICGHIGEMPSPGRTGLQIMREYSQYVRYVPPRPERPLRVCGPMERKDFCWSPERIADINRDQPRLWTPSGVGNGVTQRLTGGWA